jgi:HAMP domain-containing protein
MRQLKRNNLSRKSLVVQFAWAFILMSMIPLVIAVSLLFMADAPTLMGRIEQARLAVFWMFVSSIAGYFVIRKAVITLSGLTEQVRDVIKGNLSKRILLDEDSEIGELARYFDNITKNLEIKIRELEASKKLVQGIFHKIGEASTSSRGIDSLLELILQSMAGAMNARGGFIMLTSPGREWLEHSVSYSEDGKPRKLPPVKIGEGTIGRVVKDNKPVIDSGMACVPLVYKNNTIGVMAVYDMKEGMAFDQDMLGLFNDVASQTAMAISNYQLNLDVEKAYLDTIRALAMAVEAKDPYSGGHLARVAKYATDIGRALKFNEEDMKVLHDVAYLHDLGKIGIRDEVLLKPGKLSVDEYEEMKKHPVIGETIMKPVKSLTKLCAAVRSHQERWDGSGYPDSLKGEHIPLHARILAVADVYDALVTERPYKKALTKQQAKEELNKLAGVKLDKNIVDAFLETL